MHVAMLTRDTPLTVVLDDNLIAHKVYVEFTSALPR
jgi:hypothetical protein